MRRASCLVSPIPDHAFFEQSQFEGLLGDNFLEVLRFAPEPLDLVGRRRTSSVPGKPALAGLEKLLRPGVIHALGNAFAPAKLGDRGFAAKAIEHDADLLFRPMVLPSCASDVADNAFRRRGHGLGFLSHLRSLAATMSQKSSLPQAASSVSQVLKRDNRDREGAGHWAVTTRRPTRLVTENHPSRRVFRKAHPATRAENQKGFQSHSIRELSLSR